MADSPKSKKSSWEKLQSLMIILTPLVLAVLGFYFNQSLTKVQRSIASVEAMAPYFNMMADTNEAKVKMAAYALYMLLKKDDPTMAASLILAPGKEVLNDVLKDLALRDENIRRIVMELASSDTQSVEMSEFQKSAQKIVKSVVRSADGWCYLGQFIPGEERSHRIDLGDDTRPRKGQSYTLNRDVSLRAIKPIYKRDLPEVVGVANKRDVITIMELPDPPKSKKVWAKVVVTKPQELTAK